MRYTSVHVYVSLSLSIYIYIYIYKYVYMADGSELLHGTLLTALNQDRRPSQAKIREGNIDVDVESPGVLTSKQLSV